MTVPCQPLPRTVAEEMLQVVARAICDRPKDQPAQRDSRTRQMVYGTMSFDPRDGLEYMLATMMVGHYNLILDGMFDVLQGPAEMVKARTRSTVVSLDRALLSFLKEMRLSRLRPLAPGAEDAVHGDTASAETVSAAEPTPEPLAAARERSPAPEPPTSAVPEPVPPVAVRAKAAAQSGAAV